MKIYVAILSLLCLHGCAEKKQSNFAAFEGKPMPSFDVLLKDSSTHYNTNDLVAGQPSVLMYVSSNCAFCRAQIKSITENMDKYKKVNFLVVVNREGLNMNGFIDRNGLNKFRNITISIDYNDSIVNYYKLTSVPFIAIFDQQKKMLHAQIGNMTERDFTKNIEHAFQ